MTIKPLGFFAAGLASLAVIAHADASPCTLDGTYGDHGLARIVLPQFPVYAVDAVRDGGGRLVIAARSGLKYALIRLDRDGNPDASFGDGGVVIKDYSSSGMYGSSLGIAVDSSDAVYLAGSSGNYMIGTQVLFVAKFDPSGTPALDYGIDGVAGYPNNQGGFSDLAVDSHGRAVATLVSPTKIAVRFDSSGDLDKSFGLSGTAVFPVGSGGRPTAVAFDGDLILIGGMGAYRLWAARLLSDGLPDMSFGQGSGFVELATGNDNTGVTAMAFHENAGIVLVGSDSPPPPPYAERYRVIVARFDRDGVPVAGFGVGGLLGTNVEPGVVVRDYAWGVDIDADGRLSIGAVTRFEPVWVNPHAGDMALMRLSAAGGPADSECDATTRLPTDSGLVGSAGEVVADGSRKLLVGLDDKSSNTVLVFAVEPGLLLRSGFE